MPTWLFSPLFRYGLAAIAVAAALGWLHHRVDAAGYDRCKAEWAKAVSDAKGKRDADLEVARIQGEVLAKELVKQQQKNTALSKEYLTYANSITGNCPPAIGVLVGAASSSAGLPEAAGKPADQAAPDGAPTAAEIGANIAENYTRFAQCLAGFNSLVDWHVGAEESLK